MYKTQCNNCFPNHITGTLIYQIIHDFSALFSTLFTLQKFTSLWGKLVHFTFPGPWRWTECQEKGAGGFLQDEWEFRLSKPQFSQQSLQIYAVSRWDYHMRTDAVTLHNIIFCPLMYTHPLVPLPAGLLFFFSCFTSNGRILILPLGFFIVLVNIYVFIHVLMCVIRHPDIISTPIQCLLSFSFQACFRFLNNVIQRPFIGVSWRYQIICFND